MTEKRPGPTQAVRLNDVSVKRELTVFTDEHGIVRCMERLSQAQLPPSTKYPILLD